MARFPDEMVEAAHAAGLRLSTFEWTAGDLPGREAATGTAVVGDPERLEAFQDRFVAARIGADGAVRTLLAKPDEQTAETVLYFPGYHLDEEPEQV